MNTQSNQQQKLIDQISEKKQQEKNDNHNLQQQEQQKQQQHYDPIQINPIEPQNQKFISHDPTLSQKLKSQGNSLFKESNYEESILKYKQSLRYTIQTQQKLRSILYSNIAICLSKNYNYKKSIEYGKKAVKQDPTYLKAYMNLAMTYQKQNNIQQALQCYKKILNINSKDISMIKKIQQLEIKVAQLNQKRKKQAIDGLKTLGNSFLGLFGMSLDNFKMQQSQGGGYNVSFKK